MKVTAVVPDESVDPATVDLFDPAFYATGDPHPVWATMRASAPLHRQVLADGREFLSVTRHHDACRVLGNHQEFTSERGTILNQLGRGDPAAGKMLVSTDPPRHAELRQPLNRPLSAKAVAAREEHIRRAVRHVLRPGSEGEVWDLAERAVELPMAVAGAVLGLPEPDWAQLSRWTSMAAAPDEPELRVRTEAATLAIAHHGLFEYFADVARRHTGNGGLLDHLVCMRAGERHLTAEEIVYNCYSLLLGANATTPHAVTGTVLAMIVHPDEYARAADAIPGLVEEGLRWTSPANSFLRHAVRDVHLSGGTVRSGEAVAVWIGSANRDEDVFADPYRFDVTRSNNRHLAFGHGPHYCLGAPLARLTLRVFFTEFFRMFESVELVGPVRHLASHFIAGLTHLPVRTRPRRRTALAD